MESRIERIEVVDSAIDGRAASIAFIGASSTGSADFGDCRRGTS
jgi:hypothetical protein